MDLSITTLTGALAVATIIVGYLLRGRLPVLLCLAASTVLWAIHFWLQSAHTTALVLLVSTVRLLLSVYSLTWTAATRKRLSAGLIAGVLVLAALSWEGFKSVIPAVATVLLTYSTLNLQMTPMRKVFIGCEVLWFVNALIIGSTWSMGAALLGFAVNVYRVTRDPR